VIAALSTKLSALDHFNSIDQVVSKHISAILPYMIFSKGRYPMKRLFTLVFALLLAASVSFAADNKATPAVPAMPATPAAPAVPAKPAVPAAKIELIDINSATEAELKAIPGIGDAYAKKIIAVRPFANESQLLSKKIIPKPVYDKVKDMIIAKQAKK
jgi:predicted DNA-binding helix-hairpin-helix protein